MLFIYNSKVAPVFYEPLVTDSFYRCNLGTVQRYLSTCYTEEGPILDHCHFNDSLFLAHRLLFSLAIYPMEPQDARNSNVGHIIYPSILL